MEVNKPHIDPYMFERQFEAFKAFVEEKSGMAFKSFDLNYFTSEQEGYKDDIYREARRALAFQEWKQSDIGSGEIVETAIRAIEVPQNNLVRWQGRFGEERRPHQPLYNARGNKEQLLVIEKCLFNLYLGENDKEAFSELVSIFRKEYPLLAYFFFLKDRSRYVPIAPTYFDRAFELLAVKFKTSRRCSWENYTIYIDLITELKSMLAESISEVRLLNAHSFAWMLADQMYKEDKLADVQEYLDLSTSERDVIVKARIGQGLFRQKLIDYWSGCAVTGCRETVLLRASHIKPWANASLSERFSLYNGLLLSPTLDTCFDAGYISFEDTGIILISEHLTTGDAAALAIHSEMRLKKIELKHKIYLSYHREYIFK